MKRINFHPHLQSEDLQTQKKHKVWNVRDVFFKDTQTGSIVEVRQLQISCMISEKHACTGVRANDTIIILTFVRGDWDVCDEGVQLVWRIFVFIAFPGQTHTHAVRHIPAKHKTSLLSIGWVTMNDTTKMPPLWSVCRECFNLFLSTNRQYNQFQVTAVRNRRALWPNKVVLSVNFVNTASVTTTKAFKLHLTHTYTLGLSI